MKKSYIFGVVFVLFLVGVFAYASIPNPGHGGNEVIVSVAGVQKYLQTAINDTSLFSNNLVSAAPPASPVGHSGDEVMITINSLDMTLQTAIDEGLFVCAIPISYSDNTEVIPFSAVYDSTKGAACAPGYTLASSCNKEFSADVTYSCTKQTYTFQGGLNGVSCRWRKESGFAANGKCLFSFTCTKN